MLLIDADNVSVDVMEQALRLLMNQHGGVHVRRAYCTPESAVANQAMFKRLGIKPMVNLAAGKNSTDIAMAVDAIDLVLAERPDVVAIASSDSDFAPLVQRLREKGCVVRGIGQKGKVADETQDVYDDYTVLEHRKPAGSEAAARPARKTTARKTTARKTAASEPAATKAAARKTPAAKKAATKTPAAKTPRKTAARKRAAARDDVADAPLADQVLGALEAATLQAPTPTAAQAPARAPAAERPPAPASRRAEAPAPEPRQAASQRMATPAQVLACLPEIAAGQSLALNTAVQRLREAQLLGKNSSSLKLFAQLADRLEVLPADKPTQVRLRR
jgi:uncharacterized protein (TIGR00288 family)